MRDKKKEITDAKEAYKILTPRQVEVVLRVAQGQTSRQIASELGIAPSTVKTHRRNICGELGLRGPNTLTRWSIERKRQLI